MNVQFTGRTPKLNLQSDVRPIIWSYVSAKEQSHQMCRYCKEKAEFMRKQGKQGWVAICVKHAIKRSKNPKV